MKNKKQEYYTLPKGEIVWVSFESDGIPHHIITSKLSTRDFYYIYQVDPDGLKKLGKNKNPKELEAKYIKG